MNLPSRLRPLKKRHVTLIEMMVVMFLIALIAGVLAYNLGGSFDKGKVLATELKMEKIKNVLSLQIAEEPEKLAKLQEEWQTYLKESPLLVNPEGFFTDAWGMPFEVTLNENGPSGFPEVEIISPGLVRYKEHRNGSQ